MARTSAAKAADAAPSTAPSIDGRDLIGALTNGALFADHSGYTPRLGTVLLRSQDGSLLAVSTDRYVFGTTSIPYNGPTLDHPIPIDGVKELLTLLKLRKPRKAQDSYPVDVTVNDRDVTFVIGTASLTYTARPAAEFPAYARMMALLDKATDDSAAPLIGVNPTLLAKFSKLAVRSVTAPMRVRVPNSPAGAIRLEVDNFRGLLMPMRLEGVTP